MRKNIFLAVIVFLILVFCSIVILIYNNNFRNSYPDYVKLQILMCKDLNMLESSNLLHPEWPKVKKVVFSPTSSKSKELLKKMKFHCVKSKKEGSHLLEIGVADFKDSGDEGVILEFNLYEEKSKNKVWELGRTYFLSHKKDKKSFLNEIFEYIANVDVELIAIMDSEYRIQKDKLIIFSKSTN